LNFYEIISIPDNFDKKAFIESLLGEAFIMYYEPKGMHAYLVSKSNGNLSGCSLLQKEISGDFAFLAAYPTSSIENAIERAYIDGFGLIFAFVPASKDYVEEVKRRTEKRLSEYGVRFVKSLGPHSGSIQMDLFYKYDERKLLESIIEMLGKIIIENGRSYKFFILSKDEHYEKVSKLFETSLILMENGHISFNSIEEAFAKLSKIESIPLSTEYVSKLLHIPRSVKRLNNIDTPFPSPGGSISVGHFMDGSIRESNIEVKLSPSSFNLGCLITGVPGTGKSFAAMHMIEQLLKQGSKVVVISPTKEWSYFAVKNNIKLIRLYSSNNFKINFFKCDSSIPIEKFYENLAMLIASASRAGPYTYSMEKSLLSAFHKAYSSNAPDPQEVYNQIEDAIIEQHAKKNNVGVKYSKHGENIMASLENLRLMLSRPEFSYKEGLDFLSLIDGSVVFDLSNVSNNMKPFFYSLILNQIYSIADTFPEDGDEKLRLEIVLEEAQMVFGSDELSAPVLDLKERMQDFRKKGIGAMLITHNIVDINQSIRRLCQNKFYFRQSPDMVKFAISDMGLSESASNRLKNLERGLCAINYIDSSKLPNGPMFVKMNNFYLPECEIKDSLSKRYYKDTKIIIGENFNGKEVELYYLGEKISSSKIENGVVLFKGLIAGKEYSILILGEKKKDTISLKFKAEELVDLSKEPALHK
jgi:DNA helicase HerA-like ATPase